MQQAIRNIVIVGAGVRAWLPAAYLAARFPDRACQIIIASSDDDVEETDILARPDSRRLHQVLQLTEQELVAQAQARPALLSAVSTKSGQVVSLPFGAYGVDRGGTQFYQYWRRAALAGQAAPIERYNLAFQLAAARTFMPKPPGGFPSFDYGYTLSRSGYGNLLKRYALNAGVVDGGCFLSADVLADVQRMSSVCASNLKIDCDMVLDATATARVAALIGAREAGWAGNCLALTEPSTMAGMELHTLQTAMERLIALLPGRDFAACETAEYDRLLRAEHSRISDMAALLLDGEKSAALQRKINVFSARGRIPVEDHEVFTKPEWQAALMACVDQPQIYDRLADRVSLEDTVVWLDDLERAIQQLLQRLQQKVAI